MATLPIPGTMIRPRPAYPSSLSIEEIRVRYHEVLGEFSTPSSPLNLRVVDERELAGSVVCQRVLYDVTPDETVEALHMFPTDIASDAPGVLSIHGHGGDEIFAPGKDYHARDCTDDPTQYTYRLALAGFRTLAPDALCFGSRRAKFGHSVGFADEIAKYTELVGLGKSLAWKAVWDNSRAIEILELLGSAAIGAMGWSGGSTQCYVLASANEKVKAAVCYHSFMTLRHQFYQFRCYHCLYHFIPKMMQVGIDWDQVVALIPPRKVFFGWGALDEGTPEPMYRAFVSAIERRCETAGLPRSITTYEEPDKGHVITELMLCAALEFLKKELV